MGSYTPWTSPTAGVHPRIWTTPAGLAALQTRIAGTHLAVWTALRQHCEGALARPASSWAAAEAEDLGGLAFAYLLDPAGGAPYAAKAEEVALYLASLPIEGGTAGRHRALALALVYDWAYAALETTSRSALRGRIAAYVEVLYPTLPQDKLQGPSLARNAFAAVALVGILEDGTAAETTLWRGWMDYILDQFDPSASAVTDGYLSALRLFFAAGDAHLGAGPFSGTSELLEVLARLLPALETGIAVSWRSEAWVDLPIRHLLWTWRGDRTFHRTGAEQTTPAAYSRGILPYVLQVASRQVNSLGEAAQWLYEEVRSLAPISGGQWLWPVLWWEASRASVRPTSAIMGSTMRVGQEYGQIQIRDGWDELGTSMVIEAPKYFLGGRQNRRVGSFVLATQGRPLFYDKGHPDPVQDITPKTTDSAQTGHRFTYAKRIPAAGCAIRIFDTDEPTEAMLDSFQRLLSADSRFGVLQGDGSITISNDGGPQFPKNTGNTKDRPWSRVDLSDAKWAFPNTITFWAEDSRYCYALLEPRPHYYSGKVTTYRRHVLWVKAGAIPGWRRPAIIVIDDLVTHVDAVKGAQTQVLEINAAAAPGSSGSFLTYANGAAKAFVLVSRPSGATRSDVTDFTLEGVSYPATNPAASDDPAGVRSDFYGAGVAAQRFAVTILPCASSVSTPPTVVFSEGTTAWTITINGIAITIQRATPWGVVVAASADVSPPAAPGSIYATAATGSVNITWAAVAAADLEIYRIYRGASSSGPWTKIGETAVTSYRDETVTNGTTYWFTVAAVDTSGNEGPKGTAYTATPAIGIAGPIRRRPPRRRNSREARYSRAARDRDYEDPDPIR